MKGIFKHYNKKELFIDYKNTLNLQKANYTIIIIKYLDNKMI